jgi:hemolysin activation/secretion protein
MSIPGVFIAAALTGLMSGFAAQAQKTVPPQILHFDIQEFQVEGNTVLPTIRIEQAVYPYLGAGKTIEEVELARAALEKSYRDSGYAAVLVSIPEQKVDAGIVKLKVTEGTVEHLRVLGSRFYSQERIRKKLAAASPGRVPYFPDVQSQLNRVNRFPGRRVTPVLRPGQAAGTTEIDLNVEDKRPYGGSVEVNNRHSPNTTGTRFNASARYENLWQREHTLSFQFQTAPEKPSEAKVFSLSYLIPSEVSDNLYVFYAVKSDSSVAALSDVTVLGKGNILGARAIFPMASAGDWSHSASFGVDYKDFEENIGLAGAPGIRTPIQYLPFSMTYDATIQDAKGYWQTSQGLNFSFRGLVSEQREFEDKRFKARDNFFVWKWDLRRMQNLPWGFSMLARIDGQFADQPLVANEQYSAGGVESVRGYLESEQAGDEAVHGGIELRTPSAASGKFTGIDQLTGHLFVEGARLFLKDSLPGQQNSFTLSSAGVGMRLKAWKKLDAGLGLAWPLKETASSVRRDPRLHFHLRFEL